jgi:RNA recognition motif-containing protein
MEARHPDISGPRGLQSRILLIPLIEPATSCRSLPSAALRVGGKVSKRIHVGNLPAATTAIDLSNMFGRFGVVDRTEIQKDRQTAGGRCFGIVEMATAAAASTAIQRLNLSQFAELTICVHLAPA